MTDPNHFKQYLEVLAELWRLRSPTETDRLSQKDEARFAAQLDQHWQALTEAEQKDLEILNERCGRAGTLFFHVLASIVPDALIAYIQDDRLSSGLRSSAAQAMSKVRSAELVHATLLPLLTQLDDRPLVLEGVVYGLENHLTEPALLALTQLSNDRLRPGLARSAANELLAKHERETDT